VGPLLVIATLMLVYALRNKRAKARLAVGRLPSTLRCSVRRTYDRSRPTMWIEGQIHLTDGQPPVWIAAPDQANTRIVLDPADYRLVPEDRSGEIVLAEVVTLAAEGVRIEVALTAAEAAVFAPLFAELPHPQG